MYLTQEELQSLFKLIDLNPIQSGQNKLEYLEMAVEKFLEYIPFQNIFLMSVPVSERRAFTFNEIKKQVLSGQGGFCQICNIFFYAFLKTIGYDAYLLDSDYKQIKSNHSVILVQNVLETGDRYLIDVGQASVQAPIPINFEQKSPVYSFAFSQMYFEWDEKKENIVKYVINRQGESQVLYIVKLTPFQDMETLLQIQSHIYSNPNSTDLADCIKILRFPKSGSLALVNQQLLTENDENKLIREISKFQDTEHFLQCVQNNFPHMNLDKCRIAYENWINSN